MMSETPSKRQREETHLVEDNEQDPKRHKSLTHILSLLEDEEDEPNLDFSSILTTLQRELSGDSATTSDEPSSLPTATSEFSHGGLKGDDEEDETERFMRHLLEASDDELGLPNRADGGGDELVHSGDAVALGGDGLWELDDEAANYYTLLQSELFM
ncbi:hypothetical protein LOK49_LG03G00430 [Camellia lanceoleosa]|uniref:Uncharacterized protein n=1 Tax=Camellia lanceoleosa TaxID=1840588 RepID=A0ACC0I5V2_9ERIC|nr:hypothetical protein LOK49_LG03G00430 [Camellia lanceoleosa]